VASVVRYRPFVRAGRRRVDPGLILLLTPVLWGASFPATKLALRRLPVPAFMAWSRGLGFLAVLALVPLLRRMGGGERRAFRVIVVPGLILGALMFVGYFLQTEGQARTTATNAGFITGLYVVFAPILASALFGMRVPKAAWIAVAISAIGLGLLSIRDLGQIQVHAGDLLVLAGAVAWAGHITAVGHFSPRYPAWMLSLGQLGVAATLHLVAATATGLRPQTVVSSKVWPLLILTGVMGSGIAFTIQLVGQRTVTAARAVVLLAGESLFSAAFAALWLGERLSLHQWGGAALVLAAMAYSELAARKAAATLLEPA
jgi:drug/metabolite transporter (DMT)-like permease